MRAAVVLLLVPAMLPAQSTLAAAVDAARAGGVVIACRHAMTDSFNENEATLRYDDSTTQRRLSPRGVRQAEILGRAFAALQFPIAEAVASPMHRARRTAELIGASALVLDSAWHTRGTDYTGWKSVRRIEHLSSAPQRGNRLIVSHVGTMQSAIRGLPANSQEGDCGVVRPLGLERFEVAGILRWRELLRSAGMSDSIP
jgi:phosphohistidine phosphatase SixA